MTNKQWATRPWWVACGCLWFTAVSAGQVVERHAKQTGPGGRTIERSIRTERGPGYVERRVDINRSTGASLSRETVIRNGPGGRPMGGPPPRPVRYPSGPAFAAGLVAAPFLSFSFGSPPPPPPPPPPIVVIPEPIYTYAPPPVVIAAPAPRYVVAPEPAPPPVADPLADALGRLKSFHANSRRDGSLTLGHLGDDRALPALMERLERDGDRDVRVAAAWALGEIGDPRSAVSLERAALYDKKHEVREAADQAYRRLPRPGQPSSTADRVYEERTDDPGPAQNSQLTPLERDNREQGGPVLEGPAGVGSSGRPS